MQTLLVHDKVTGELVAELAIDGIERCACFVLLMSQHANASAFVLREVERAFDRPLRRFLGRRPDRRVQEEPRDDDRQD